LILAAGVALRLDAVGWIEERWGIRYSYHGLSALLKRHALHLKAPRPRSDKTDPQQQEAWKKGV